MLGVMDPIHRAWVVQWEHCGEGSNRFPADKLLKATRKRTSSRVLTLLAGIQVRYKGASLIMW